MRDPLEGLSKSGTIQTGADIRRVAETFRPVHREAVAMTQERETSASVYAYGSVVTGQATPGVSDVDLLTIGLIPSDANQIGTELSARFAEICRGVEIGAAEGCDFVGESDESYGNRVFLRHYCVPLAGPDVTVRSTTSLRTVVRSVVSTVISANTPDDGEPLSTQEPRQDS